MEDVGKALDTIVLQAVQCMPARAKGFAPAGATKGLSDRPLETFGPYACRYACTPGNRKFPPGRFRLKKIRFLQHPAPSRCFLREAFLPPAASWPDGFFYALFFNFFRQGY